METLLSLWNMFLDAMLGTNRDDTRVRELRETPLRLFHTANVSAFLPYRESAVRDALWLFKYRGNKLVADQCAELLYENMLEEMSEINTMEGKDSILLVPIPNSEKKKRERGFNQTEILCRCIAKKDSSKILEYRDDVLYKIKDTESQAKIKDRAKRLRNVKDTMQATEEKVSGKTIFLVDDITTTGATFSEATRALKAAGAKKILCFAIAH